MGFFGAATHEPKFTMSNAKCQLEGYKAPQDWAVEFSRMMDPHPVPLGLAGVVFVINN